MTDEPTKAMDSPPSQRRVRCTYCLEWLPLACFTKMGDHVIPAAMGGGWIDAQVCEDCNRRANAVADELVIKDPVTVFLRSSYGIPDRYGKVPKAPRVAVRTAAGSVVLVTLAPGKMEFSPATLSPEDEEHLRLNAADATDDRLKLIVDRALGRDAAPADIAKNQQAKSTPRDAWSRFIAKVALACGREAYGEPWLDSGYARVLSTDLLSDRPSPDSQLGPHPPVEEAWPWKPPQHRLWIQDHDGAAILMMLLFGQVWAAAAVNRSGVDAYPTSWSMRPHERSVDRSTYPAVWIGTAAARATASGRNALMVDLPDGPVLFIEDGPHGPIETGQPMVPVQSPQDAIQQLAKEGRDFFKRARVL